MKFANEKVCCKIARSSRAMTGLRWVLVYRSGSIWQPLQICWRKLCTQHCTMVQDVIRLKALGLFLDRFARKVYAKLFHDFSVNFRKHHGCVHLRAFKLGQLVYGDLCILIVF